MLQHIQVVPIPVRDLDAAARFYTEKLGFEIGTDFTMENGYRWLTVKLPDQAAPEVVFMLADENEVGGINNGFSFHSNDCVATYKLLKERGVEFEETPTQQMWGTQAVFKDQDGNVHVIVQPAPMPAA